jgi:hypothetical protein
VKDGPLPGLPDLQISPHCVFPVGLYERWRSRSVNVYNPKQLERMNYEIAKTEQTLCKIRGMNSSAGAKMERRNTYIFWNWIGYENILSCSL